MVCPYWGIWSFSSVPDTRQSSSACNRLIQGLPAGRTPFRSLETISEQFITEHLNIHHGIMYLILPHCVCAGVCACTCMCVSVSVSMRALCVHMHVCLHICVWVYMCVHACVCVHDCVHACACVCMYVWVSMHVWRMIKQAFGKRMEIFSMHWRLQLPMMTENNSVSTWKLWLYLN